MPQRGSATMEIAPDLAQVSSARRFVRAELGTVVSADVVLDLQLLASELVTNAIEHGEPERVLLVVSWSDDLASVSVHSYGPSPDVGPVGSWSLADVEEITGRGLGIVREVADGIVVDQTPDELTITVHRQLSRSACG